MLARQEVARLFTKNLAVAGGLGRTGYSVGLFVVAPLAQLFLNTYGWRGTMLLLGGISLHASVCGALIVTSEWRRPPLQESGYQKLSLDEAPDHTRSESSCTSLCGSITKNLNMELLVSARYWTAGVAECCCNYTFIMWTVYFVSQAQSNGFSAEDAGVFVTSAGIGDLFAKLFVGFITGRGLMSSWTMATLSATFLSMLYCATPWVTSYWLMILTSFLTLLNNGAFKPQMDVLIKELLPAESLVGAFGWTSLLTALLSFSLGFLPGKQ